jgi:DNA-binding NtrC family response regulator
MNKILIIDDEVEICESIKMILEYEDYEVEYFIDANKGIEHLKENPFSVLLLDIQMPRITGFEVLKRIDELENKPNVIMISAHGSVENAIRATKLGAFDFIEKPIDRDKLLISVRNASERAILVSENSKLKKVLDVEYSMVGKSEVLALILKTIERVAKSDARVLITGENGTGKELAARELHNKSERHDKPFIEVNCAAIPNELIESELFGHEKGAFTGANQQRIGRFEAANKGTLFLDEIGDMSIQAQAKVLRAIEDGKIERVGGNKKIDVDVRIVSATNKNLEKEIEEGNFREDLFHRLNVIPITIPPLRERKDDIVELVNHFSKIICEKNKFAPVTFDKNALELLKSNNWSGNIRELKNIVERIIIMVPKDHITSNDIIHLLPNSKSKNDDLLNISNSFQEFKEVTEKAFIQKQLELNDWNISKTAEILDIQRSHLYTKMKKYNIEKE